MKNLKAEIIVTTLVHEQGMPHYQLAELILRRLDHYDAVHRADDHRGNIDWSDETDSDDELADEPIKHPQTRAEWEARQ